MYRTLISAADLKKHLHDPLWVVVDCRFELMRPEAGRLSYLAGHIPGAHYAHLNEDLSGPVGAHTGRHPLPAPTTLATRFGGWGIDEHTQVVAYDTDNGSMAARLWWLLRWLGHDAVAVLDGGVKAWEAAGLALTTAITPEVPKQFTGQPRPDMWMTAQQVEARASDPTWRLLDARAPERFAGEVEPIDRVAGHVPGAFNHPFSRNLAPDGRFLPVEQLRTQFADSLAGVSPARTIAMCGSGVTAAHNLLALEHAGLPGAYLYAGSWSEWIVDSSRPISR